MSLFPRYTGSLPGTMEQMGQGEQTMTAVQPAIDTGRLSEPLSLDLVAQMRQVGVPTVLSVGDSGSGDAQSDTTVDTNYVQGGTGDPPLLLLHGFDSSVLEFRRLWPRLVPHYRTWLVDLLGFGFTERQPDFPFSPAAIKAHLYGFWQTQIGQPMVLVGASMGGAAALDFALTYPDAVAALVLLDSAGLAAGPAMGKLMVPPLDRWATAFLRNPGVRRRISRQAYFDRGMVTDDAEACADLHLACPRWSEALIAFTKSGGYNFLRPHIQNITCPTLVLWGRQDKILGTADANAFQRVLPDGTLVWVDRCGHVPHLEQPEATATALVEFCNALTAPQP